MSNLLFLFMSRAATSFFFFNATSPPALYSLSLHDALPIFLQVVVAALADVVGESRRQQALVERRRSRHRKRSIVHEGRSEEHTSELQSLRHLVCRLLLEKKKYNK